MTQTESTESRKDSLVRAVKEENESLLEVGTAEFGPGADHSDCKSQSSSRKPGGSVKGCLVHTALLLPQMMMKAEYSSVLGRLLI